MFSKEILKKTSKECFISGFMKGLNYADYLYNPPQHKLITKKDMRQMTRNSWERVGKDLSKAMENYEQN